MATNLALVVRDGGTTAGAHSDADADAAPDGPLTPCGIAAVCPTGAETSVAVCDERRIRATASGNNGRKNRKSC